MCFSRNKSYKTIHFLYAKYKTGFQVMYFNSKSKYKSICFISNINKGSIKYQLVNREDHSIISSGEISSGNVNLNLIENKKYKISLSYESFSGSIKVRLIKYL